MPRTSNTTPVNRPSPEFPAISLAQTGSARAGVGNLTPQPGRGVVVDRGSRSPRSATSSEGPPTARRQTSNTRARTNLDAVLSTASATPQTMPAVRPSMADIVRGQQQPNTTSPPSATPTPQEPNLTQPTQVQAPCSCKMAYLQNSAQTKALSDEWALTPEEEKCIGRAIRTMSPSARSETTGRMIGVANWRHQWLRACLVMVAVIEGTLLREGHRYPHLPETPITQTLTLACARTGHYCGGRGGNGLRGRDAPPPHHQTSTPQQTQLHRTLHRSNRHRRTQSRRRRFTRARGSWIPHSRALPPRTSR